MTIRTAVMSLREFPSRHTSPRCPNVRFQPVRPFHHSTLPAAVSEARAPRPLEPPPHYRIQQRAKDLLGNLQGREQLRRKLRESVPLLLGFGDDCSESGVLALGRVVLEGWKVALTLPVVGSLWGHFGTKRR